LAGLVLDDPEVSAAITGENICNLKVNEMGVKLEAADDGVVLSVSRPGNEWMLRMGDLFS
jgi:hypothetical protein